MSASISLHDRRQVFTDKSLPLLADASDAFTHRDPIDRDAENETNQNSLRHTPQPTPYTQLGTKKKGPETIVTGPLVSTMGPALSVNRGGPFPATPENRLKPLRLPFAAIQSRIFMT